MESNRLTGVGDTMKEFNTTGLCIPKKHYMVDISDKLEKIIALIEKDKYFTINRSRQYGKTTTLNALCERLQDRYQVVWLSFEGMGDAAFENDVAFMKNFVRKFAKELRFTKVTEEAKKRWSDVSDYKEEEYEDAFEYLGEKITKICQQSEKEILLFVDEVDKSVDNQVFLHFLGMLRNKYLFRESGRDYTFKSVILAGVYDIKNLKVKLRPKEERKYNSPWNIAVDFDVDMSFSPKEIATMLKEYELDYHTGMDMKKICEEIYAYTSGYPYLVSCICKWIDEQGQKCWTTEGVKSAVKSILKTRTTLLDDLIKNVENYSEIKEIVLDILYQGKEIVFHPAVPAIELGAVLGIWKEKNGCIAISNLIFERYLYDYSVGVKELENKLLSPPRNQFIHDNHLNMELVLIKFQELMQSEHRDSDEKFLERQGRLLFLCFLKPIINGTGFYYVEPETRDSERMDIVVAYGAEEFIIELKIWRGMEYRKKGIQQLEAYMDSRNAKKGYLVSFSFLKNKTFTSGWREDTGKEIFEVTI